MASNRARILSTVIGTSVCACGARFPLTVKRLWNGSTAWCRRGCNPYARRFAFRSETLTVAEICQRTGLKWSTVWKRLRVGDRNPFRPVKIHAPTNLTPARIKRAREKWRQGVSLASIGREWGVGASTLQRAVNKALQAEREARSFAAMGRRRAA